MWLCFHSLSDFLVLLQSWLHKPSRIGHVPSLQGLKSRYFLAAIRRTIINGSVVHIWNSIQLFILRRHCLRHVSTGLSLNSTCPATIGSANLWWRVVKRLDCLILGWILLGMTLNFLRHRTRLKFFLIWMKSGRSLMLLRRYALLRIRLVLLLLGAGMSLLLLILLLRLVRWYVAHSIEVYNIVCLGVLSIYSFLLQYLTHSFRLLAVLFAVIAGKTRGAKRNLKNHPVEIIHARGGWWDPTRRSPHTHSMMLLSCCEIIVGRGSVRCISCSWELLPWVVNYLLLLLKLWSHHNYGHLQGRWSSSSFHLII